MVNKDATGNSRQHRLRKARAKWLAENAKGLSPEGLIGALMRGECALVWNEPLNNPQIVDVKKRNKARINK